MKKNGTTFSRTADGTDLCDTKGPVEGIPAADGYACGTQLELAALYGYIIPRTVGGEFLQFYYTLADQPGSYADRYDDPYVTGLLLPATKTNELAMKRMAAFIIDYLILCALSSGLSMISMIVMADNNDRVLKISMRTER